MTHKLLLRQLKRCFGSANGVPPELQAFVQAVDRAYHEADEDRLLLERSMDLTSQELMERYRELQAQVGRRARVEEALQRSEEHFRALIENAADVISVLEADGTVRYHSPAIERILGYRPEELVGTSAFVGAHPEDRAALEEGFQRVSAEPGAVVTMEYRNRRREGGWRVLEVTATNLLHAPAVAGVVINSRDVTERARAEEALAHGALHDALTGLPNRALFIDRLDHAVERLRRGRGTPFAVLFLDLDRFKLVNDSLGHGVGDELLRLISARLERSLRPGDTVSRFGGDEFTILLENVTGAVEATHIAERVLQALASPFGVGAHEVFTSASIGIALCAGDARPEELLRNADAALHRAKLHGKARYEVFDREMHAAAMLRLQMETDLRRALDHGELALRYQPIIRVETGRIVGFEALLRWQHPAFGMVLPADFIPIAEETGVIVPIERWVLEQACRQLAEWQRAAPRDPPLSMSVNLSARQFTQRDLVGQIGRCLDELPVAPGSLVLEITESVLIDKADAAASVLESLSGLGVKLHLDDFGTGYASLGYLQRLPVDVVKIDRSFVHGMEHEDDKTRFIAAIVALTSRLGLQVVAEGVDAPAQLRLLRELGCDYAQGFFISEPVCAASVERLLAEDPRW